MQYAKPVTLNVEECDRLFFLPVPGKSKRMSPQAPLYPAMRGMALWVFSYVASASCAGCAVPPS
ncbi:putative antirestriction protein [Shigella sonnei]|nr:putative antirestriction protein [Shigella sonnei]